MQVFYSQYFSNKSLFSKTHASNIIESTTHFPNFTVEMYGESCDPRNLGCQVCDGGEKERNKQFTRS